MNHEFQRPVFRSQLRRKLGKKIYILRRQLTHLLRKGKWAGRIESVELKGHVVINHSSVLLRRLRAVDMELQYNKIRNLELALAKTGLVRIAPGETYSFWKLVGKPKRAKGYLDGLVLESGNLKRDVGGGLCQLGNLIYWMVLHTSLTVTERWRHSYDVFPDVERTLPFGSGATLSYNYIDLQFRNDTDRVYYMHIRLEKDFLRGEILCEPPEPFRISIYETDHRFEHQWWGAYLRCNVIWKKKVNLTTGEEELVRVCENRALMMYEPLIGTGEKDE